MAKTLIKSEDDAYRFLENYLAGNVTADEVVLKGWPKLVITVRGEKFQQSITPSAMKGFLALQDMIYRSYAEVRYGVPDARKLRREEREELELVVRVEEGSSTFEINLQELLTKLIEIVGPKMDPIHFIVIALGLGVLWAGQSSLRLFLQYRVKERRVQLKHEQEIAELNNQRFMSEQETERAKIIASLVDREPILDNASRKDHDAKAELLRRLSTADSIEMQDIEMEGHVAHELTKNARRKSEEVRLDGRYRIERVDSTSPSAFKVRVLRIGSDPEVRFDAVVQDSDLTQPNKKKLQEAEWNRKPVELKINAKSLDDAISSAVIVDVLSVDQ